MREMESRGDVMCLSGGSIKCFIFNLSLEDPRKGTNKQDPPSLQTLLHLMKWPLNLTERGGGGSDPGGQCYKALGPKNVVVDW